MKKKNVFLILIIAGLMLAACSEPKDESPIEEPASTAIVEGEEGATDPQEDGSTAPNEPFTDAEEPCKPFSLIDETLTTPFADLPPISEDDWTIGPANAAVTFMEYSELQCPFCAQLEPMLAEVQALFPNDVRLVFRHRPFPETFHDKSILAAQAMEAAGKQGKFHEFKNFMFDRQTRNPGNPDHAELAEDAFWSSVPQNDFDDWLNKNLAALDIDATQFFEDMYSKEIEKKIEEAANSANRLGINGTPKLFVNGYEWPDQRSVEKFATYTRLIVSQNDAYESCAPTVIESGKDYSATISTTKGDIVVDLYSDSAPITVNSFVFLSQEGWYDGLPFITDANFILSGDPSDTGFGGPGYAYLDELSSEHTLEDIGKLATLSLGPGYNGSTFFINKTSLEDPQGRTIFGEVTEGMDVVNSLEIRNNIFDPVIDRILSITINER